MYLLWFPLPDTPYVALNKQTKKFESIFKARKKQSEDT